MKCEPVRLPTVRAGAVCVGLFIAISAILVFSGGTAAAEPISSCTTLEEPGSYHLTDNISTNETCIEIDTDDVHLHGNGHVIEGTNITDPDYGVFASNRSNVTVEDLELTGWRYDRDNEQAVGVLYDGVDNATVRDLHFVDNTDGVLLQNIDTGTMADLSAVDNGIPIGHRWSSDVDITNVSVEESNAAVGIIDSVNSTITNVTLRDSSHSALWLNEADGLIVQNAHIVDSSTGTGIWDSKSVHLEDIEVIGGREGVLLEGTTTAVAENLSLEGQSEASVAIQTSSDISILDGQMADAEVGVEAEATTNLTVTNVEINGGSDGVSLSEGSEATVTAVSATNTSTAIAATDSGTHLVGTNVSVRGADYSFGSHEAATIDIQAGDIGMSTAPNTTVDTTLTNATIAAVETPPSTSEAAPLDRYVDVAITGDKPAATLDLSYTGEDVAGIEEESLELWAHEGTEWETVPNSSVDTVNRTASGSISTGAIVGIFGTPQPIVYEKTLENDGSVHTIGFPGPVNGTLADVFPNGTDGVSALYEYDQGGWSLVTDLDRELEALDALVLVTDGEEETVHLSVRVEPLEPADTRQATAGWNYLSASAFTDADSSFGVEDAQLVIDRYSHLSSAVYDPVDRFDSYVLGGSSWGAEPPSLNPFAGYFVYFDSEGEISSALSEITDKSEADEVLGLESE